jgi:hypothetical protein
MLKSGGHGSIDVSAYLRPVGMLRRVRSSGVIERILFLFGRGPKKDGDSGKSRPEKPDREGDKGGQRVKKPKKRIGMPKPPKERGFLGLAIVRRWLGWLLSFRLAQ